MFFFHGGLYGWSRAGKHAAGYSKQAARHHRSGSHPWLPYCPASSRVIWM
jgi:hypothetical protein